MPKHDTPPTPPTTPLLVTEALNQLPERIHVGAYPIRIRIFEPNDRDAKKNWGQFEVNTQTIWLSRDFPSLTFMGMIFTHELLHAVWWAQGLEEEGEEEERVVTLIATGLTQVYRDNPWLLDWIALTYRFDRVPPRFAVEATEALVSRKEVTKPRAKVVKPRAGRKKQSLGFIS